MKISKSASIDEGVEIHYENPAVITGQLRVRNGFRIGAYSYFRNGHVRRLASVGRYTSIGPDVTIGETEHPIDWLSTSPFQYSARWRTKWFRRTPDPFEVANADGASAPVFEQPGPVVIGNDVWIGANVFIRSGVHIGDGAICAAGSVIVREVPPYTIVGGTPAKPIRQRFAPELIRRLQETAWWRFDMRDLAGLPFDDVPKALDMLQSRIDAGLQPRLPEFKIFRK